MYDNWGKKSYTRKIEVNEVDLLVMHMHPCDDVRDWWLNLRDKTWMNFGIIWVFCRGRVIVSINNIKMLTEVVAFECGQIGWEISFLSSCSLRDGNHKRIF